MGGINKSAVGDVVGRLIDLLGLKEVEFDVSEADDSSFLVTFKAGDPGILIGRRGETLGSLQQIVSQILYREFNKDDKSTSFRVTLDVADWRARREEYLTSLALAHARSAKESGVEQHIYDLSPVDRRFIHILLEKENDVRTESFGDGKDRHLVIYPKS